MCAGPGSLFCGRNLQSETGRDKSIVSDTLEEKGEKEGYDTLSANYFSDYKVNDIKKLLPTDPQNFKDDDIDIEYNSSTGFVTWDYITCNGTVQKRTGSKWGMDYLPYPGRAAEWDPVPV